MFYSKLLFYIKRGIWMECRNFFSVQLLNKFSQLFQTFRVHERNAEGMGKNEPVSVGC